MAIPAAASRALLRSACASLFCAAFVLPPARAADPPWIARATGGMVASDSPEAAQIGADILKSGGNAFDAAVATSFALAVSRPESTGLGGGGFMLAYHAGDQRIVALDFRETAPSDARLERFAAARADSPRGPSPSIYGGLAIATPGQLAGLVEINKRYGTQPLAELLRPAITLAQTGFAADAHFRGACRSALRDFEKWPPLKHWHATLYMGLLNGGEPPEIGTLVQRPDLADALRLIAQDGPQAFYDGPIAEAIVAAAQKSGGVLARADLRAYQVRERQPLLGLWRDYRIFAMPPPSSGGVCLLEMLNIYQAAQTQPDLRAPELRPHVLVEALKHAFADRARWLADPDFSPLPPVDLLHPLYAAELAGRIKPNSILPPESYGTPATATAPAEDGGTSHFCVADAQGNVVALTETVNGMFGSFVVAAPYGIILNNEMDDFVTHPGQPNLFGLTQSPRNQPVPGKRPLSSMSPTIVLRGERPVLVLGGSGGPRIITAVAQVLLNVLERGQPLEDALAAPRLHHQWLPNEVSFDREPPAEWAEWLRRSGHELSRAREGAVVQAINWLPDGTLVGGSDPRKGGRPVGVP